MNDIKKRVQEDFEKFSADYPEDAYIKSLVLDEKSTYSSPREANNVGVDYVYATQHQYAMNWLMEIEAANKGKFSVARKGGECQYQCLDVGSQFSFVSVASSLANFVIADPSLNFVGKDGTPARRMHAIDLGIMWADAEAQDLYFIEDNGMRVVTSLHAIEHFGLGRYGDTIDPEGDMKGLREFNRVLTTPGFFIGSVPIELSGSERVVFNRNRIYSIPMVQKMLRDCGFEIIDHIVASSCDSIIHSHQVHGDYTATSVRPEEFEQALTHVLKSDPELKETPNSAYVWLAKKVRNLS